MNVSCNDCVVRVKCYNGGTVKLFKHQIKDIITTRVYDYQQ